MANYEKIDRSSSPDSEHSITSLRTKECINGIFGHEVSLKEFQECFSVGEDIDCRISFDEIDDPDLNSKRLYINALLYHAGGKDAGQVDVCFSLCGGRRELFIRSRRLVEKGKGLGLDLECQIEAFCRKHGVDLICNEAETFSYYVDNGKRCSVSDDSRTIGAYVWALYGYEFKNNTTMVNLRKRIEEFANDRKITIIGDVADLKRPNDFARVRGRSSDNETVNLGKMFLTEENVYWEGYRDLSLDSQGAKDFAAYLAQRGRHDLIEKYYPMFLEKNSEIG